MSIASLEAFLIGTIKAQFAAPGGKSLLNAVESLPSDWDADMFSRLLIRTPGAFVVWGGGQAVDGTTDVAGQWHIIAVTAHANNELARRHGDTREIGAYQIIETVVPLLHEIKTPHGDRMYFDHIENLFTGEIDRKGAAVYAATFSLRMPIVASPGGPDDSTLGVFRTFDATTDLAPSDGRPEATDVVTLLQ